MTILLLFTISIPSELYRQKPINLILSNVTWSQQEGTTPHS